MGQSQRIDVYQPPHGINHRMALATHRINHRTALATHRINHRRH